MLRVKHHTFTQEIGYYIHFTTFSLLVCVFCLKLYTYFPKGLRWKEAV